MYRGVKIDFVKYKIKNEWGSEYEVAAVAVVDGKKLTDTAYAKEYALYGVQGQIDRALAQKSITGDVNLNKISGVDGFRKNDFTRNHKKMIQYVEYNSGSPSTSDAGMRVIVAFDEKTGKLSIDVIGYDFKYSREGEVTDESENAVEAIVKSQSAATKIVKQAMKDAPKHLNWV